MIEAELPDGTILEFPDGTADDVVDRTVKNHLNKAPGLFEFRRAGDMTAGDAVKSAFDYGEAAKAPTGEEQQTISNVLRQIPYGVNEALGGIAGGLEEAADYALGPLYDRDYSKPGPISGLFRNETMLGPEPKTTAQRAARAGGQMVPGTVATAGLPLGQTAQQAAQALSKSGNAVKQAAGEFVKSYGRAPGMNTAAEAAAGIGAGAGGQVASEVAPDSTAARMTGEVLGGLAPGAALTMAPGRMATKIGGKLWSKVSPATQQRNAREFIKGKLGESLQSEAAQSSIARADEIKKKVPGFKPSLAEETQDPSLLRTQEYLEDQARGEALDFVRSRRSGNLEAVDEFAKGAAPQGVADPDTALAPVENRVQGIRDKIADEQTGIANQRKSLEQQKADFAAMIRNRREQTGSELTQLRQQATDDRFAMSDAQLERSRQAQLVRDAAEEAFRRLDDDVKGQRRDVAALFGGRIDKAEVGARMRDRLNDVRGQRREELDALSKQLGLDEVNFAAPFKRFAKRVEEEIAPHSVFDEGKVVPPVYDTIVKASVLDSIPFSDVKRLRERVGRELRDATGATDGASRSRAHELRKIMQLIDDELLSTDALAPSAVDFDAGDLRAAREFVMNEDFARSYGEASKRRPQTLSQFLKGRGGLRDDAGELRSRDWGGRGGLINNKSGMYLDDAALSAWEQGYFPGYPDRPSPDDLLAALDDDVSGVQPRYREADQAAADAMDEAAGMTDDFDQLLGRLGIDSTMSPDDIRSAVLGMDATDGMQQGIPEDVARKYAAFRNKYFSDYIEPFERSASSKVRSKDGKAFYRTLDEDVAASFFKTQDGARQYASLFGQDPQALADAEAALLDDLASSALSDGVVGYPAFERWMKSKSGVLRELPPEVSSRFEQMFSRVRDLERGYAAQKNAIGQRKAQGLRDLGRASDQSSQLALEGRKQIESQSRDVRMRSEAEIAGLEQQQAAIDQALAPLSSRMETLVARERKLNNSILARKVRSLSGGGMSPDNFISQALGNQRLMFRLMASTKGDAQATEALRRIVWDRAEGLSPEQMQGFLGKYGNTLKMLFPKDHLDNLQVIQDARAMATSLREPKGRAIATDPVKMMTETIGLNPQAAMARFVNVQRGRSSKAVEMGSGLAYWFGRRNSIVNEQLMMEALYNPEVAEALVNELSSKAVREGLRPPRLTRLWMLNAALSGDGEAQE